MKKFSKGYVFYHILIDLLISAVITLYTVGALASEDAPPNISPAVFVVEFIGIYLVLLVYRILYVNLSGYELRDKDIVVKRGVLFKKTTIVEYKRMHAINKKQDIIHKLFKVAVLTVDSGSSNTAHLPEITIFENPHVVDELIDQLKAKQDGDRSIYSASAPSVGDYGKGNNLYEFSSSMKFLYSLITTFNALLVIAIVFMLFLATATTILPYMHVFPQGSIEDILAEMIIPIIIIVFACLLLTLISSFISSLFMYHNFQVFRHHGGIEVNYGLFTRHTNHFKLNKIKGIKITQSIMHRIFGYCSVKLEVVGYSVQQGDSNKTEIGVLMPLCKKSELDYLLGFILPELKPEPRTVKPKKYLPFLLWPLFFATVPLAFFVGATALGLLIVKTPSVVIVNLLICGGAVIGVIDFIVFINSLLEYSNNGITVGPRTITMYKGGFTKKITTVGRLNLIALEDITTPLRKKRGVYSYKLHYYTNATSNTSTVKHLPEDIKEVLDGALNG